jgi:hypothetical protein
VLRDVPRPINWTFINRFRFAVAKHWLCLDGGGKWREHKYIAFCGFVDTVDNLERFTESVGC